MTEDPSEVIDEDIKVEKNSMPFDTTENQEVSGIQPKILSFFNKSSVALVREFFNTLNDDWKDGNYFDFSIRIGMICVAVFVAIVFWRLSD